MILTQLDQFSELIDQRLLIQGSFLTLHLDLVSLPQWWRSQMFCLPFVGVTSF